jgi:hypothetical protein
VLGIAYYGVIGTSGFAEGVETCYGNKAQFFSWVANIAWVMSCTWLMSYWKSSWVEVLAITSRFVICPGLDVSWLSAMAFWKCQKQVVERNLGFFIVFSQTVPIDDIPKSNMLRNKVFRGLDYGLIKCSFK